jgi:hypothetical protein
VKRLVKWKLESKLLRTVCHVRNRTQSVNVVRRFVFHCLLFIVVKRIFSNRVRFCQKSKLEHYSTKPVAFIIEFIASSSSLSLFLSVVFRQAQFNVQLFDMCRFYFDIFRLCFLYVCVRV